MTEYIGKSEQTLRSLVISLALLQEENLHHICSYYNVLDDCSCFEERRKIRAAIRLLKECGVHVQNLHEKPISSSHAESGCSGTLGQIQRPSPGITRTVSNISSNRNESSFTETPSQSVSQFSSQPSNSLCRPSSLFSGDRTTTAHYSFSSQLGSRQSNDNQLFVKSSRDEHNNGSLSNIRETLNSAFLKGVTSSQSHDQPLSSSVEFRNGVSSEAGESKTRTDLSYLKEKYLSDRGIVPNIVPSNQSCSNTTSNTDVNYNGLYSETVTDRNKIRNDSYSGYSPFKTRSTLLSSNLHVSNEDVTRWRSASYSSEPMSGHGVTDKIFTRSSSSNFEDSFIDNCNSEEYLQELLVKSTDFVERRKLRTRINQLCDIQDNIQQPDEEEMLGCGMGPRGSTTVSEDINRHKQQMHSHAGDVKKSKSGDRVKSQGRIKKDNSSTKDILQPDYDKIETMDEFKTLLTLTDDHEEKRKIRNAMRQLRCRLEIEKLKLSTGSKVVKTDSGRRQSEDISLLRPSSVTVTDARRRLSEDVSKTKLKNISDKNSESSFETVKLKSVPELRLDQSPYEVEFSARSGTVTNKPSWKSGTVPVTKEVNKAHREVSSKSARAGHRQRTSQSKSEEEDFLGRLKARLSTQDKTSTWSGRQNIGEIVVSAKDRDSYADRSKVNVTSSRSGSIQPARVGHVHTVRSAHSSRNTEKDKPKVDQSLHAGKLNFADSKKVKESDVVKAKDSKLISGNKTEPTFKSSFSVKLNSVNKVPDSKDKLTVGSNITSESKKQVLPGEDKLNKDKFDTKSGSTSLKKPSQIDKGSVIKRLSQGKDSSKRLASKAKDGIELELSSISSPTVVKSQLAGDTRPLQDFTTHLLLKKTEPETILSKSSSYPTTTTATTSTSSSKTISSTPSISLLRVDETETSDTTESFEHAGVKPTTECDNNPVQSERCNKFVLRVDLKPKSKGLSRSHSDVLPQTYSWYKKSASECVSMEALESKSDMEKAFLDMLDDMEHHKTASDTKHSDVSDEDFDLSSNSGGNSGDAKKLTTHDLVVSSGNTHIEQSESWIVLRNVKEDLSAIKFVDEDEGVLTSGQHHAKMATDNSLISQERELMSSGDKEKPEMTSDEENNNMLKEVLDDVTDHLSGAGTPFSTRTCGGNVQEEAKRDTSLVSPDAVCCVGMGESAITYQEGEDGTVTVQQVSQTQNQDRVVTVKSKMYRTPSNAQVEERDTVVETKFTSPGGTQLQERDVIHTKKKITSRGSNYFQRNVHVTRRVHDKDAGEVVEQDFCVESTNKSVSQGESWGNRVITKVTMDQPEHLQPRLEASSDVPKKSHATLLLSKLNVSKASSGYGSVSGSEEEDREEMMNVKQARPKGCPEITAPMQDMVVWEGDAVVIECGAVADPAPTVNWFLGYKQIDSDDERYHIDHDSSSGKSSLTIHSAKENGVFRCVFKNQHGEAETKTTVTVQKKPEKAPVIVCGLHDLNVMEGHSLTLTCMVPDAETIAWYKDGFVQHHSADFKQSYDGDVARLEIGEVFLDDVGEYACVARNELGEDRSACQITVTACDSETSVVPMFLTPLTNSTFTVGKKLVLECDVIGSPEPEINWTKEGQPIRDDCSLNQMYDGRTAKLEIDEVQIQDSGKYQCVAKNEAGRVSSDAAVTVKVQNRAPSVQVPLSDVTNKANESAVLICQISGFPQPTIIWRKNGMMIGQTKDIKHSVDGKTIRLEIVGACSQDSGRYECVAKNGLGEISTTCTLTVTDTSSPSVKSVPEPPRESNTIMRSATPAQSIIGLALTHSVSQKSSHSQLLLSDPPGSPKAAQSITSKALMRSSSYSVVPDSNVTPAPSANSPLATHIIGRPLARSASEKVTSSSSKNLPLPQSITATAHKTETVQPPSPGLSEPSKHTQNPPDFPSSASDSRKNKPLTETILSSPVRSAPKNTIGKFLALAAARDVDQSSKVPLRTTLDIPMKSQSTSVTQTKNPDRDIMQSSAAKHPTQHLSKVQQLRLQFLRESNQSQPNKPSNSPIRRWHSLPPQDLRPTVVKREKYLESGGEQLQLQDIMPSYDDINDEEELMKIMGKTDDFDERKKIRARLKEVREKDKLEREARRQQREKEAGDVVKLKFEKAEEDKKRKMQQYSDMAQKPGAQTTTETKTSADGSKITTTTTTATSKTEDGGTRTQTVKKTETTITKTSGIGGVQYAKPGAVQTARKLSDHLQTASPPGTSGRISVKHESWNSRDGVVQKSEKTESWGAKPGGARGAMAAFKQMDSANSPAQPNAGRGRGMARSPSAIKTMLLEWCKSKTKEYENIEITNFSSCWNNGLAFCALIHHFFPDAFDYNALTPKNRRYNFDLAFDTAEKKADIAPLLDTEDMVRMKNPDWKCVFTYVQSIYRHLRDHDANKAKEQEQ